MRLDGRRGRMLMGSRPAGPAQPSGREAERPTALHEHVLRGDMKPEPAGDPY